MLKVVQSLYPIIATRTSDHSTKNIWCPGVSIPVPASSDISYQCVEQSQVFDTYREEPVSQ